MTEKDKRHSRPAKTNDGASNLLPEYTNSWAVVIGINTYDNMSHLSYAVNDAVGVANLLINEFDFPEKQVFLLKNDEASSYNILQLLENRLPELTHDNDRVLLFFAGHGKKRLLPVGERGYLAPVDAKLDDWTSFIEMKKFVGIGDSIAAKHLLCIIDACFSGLAMQRGKDEPSRYQQDMLTKRARQVLTAGLDHQAVDDTGPGGHSIFTWQLIQGLCGAPQSYDGTITASELMVHVKNNVATATESHQTPDFGNLSGHESGGDFVFLPSKPRLPSEIQNAINSDHEKFRLVGLELLGSPQEPISEAMLQLQQDILVSFLSNDDQRREQARAARSLGQLGRIQSLYNLVGKLAQSQDSELRLAISQALSDIHIQIVNWIPEEIPNIQEVTQLLIAVLQNASEPEVKESVTIILGRLKNPMTKDVLRVALKDESPVVRLEVVQALSYLTQDPDVVNALVETLKLDSSASVRLSAVKILGQLTTDKIIPSLTNALQNDSDPGVRIGVAQVLSELENPKTASTLEFSVVQDSDATVRLWSVIGLNKLKLPSSLWPFSYALQQDENTEVRRLAADALGSLGLSQALEPLSTAFRCDLEEDVRRASVAALGNLGISEALPVLIQALEDNDLAVRRDAVIALRKLGNIKAAKRIAQLLKDQDLTLRRLAAESLRDLGDSTITDELFAATQSEDKQMYWAAAIALGKLGDKRALEPLLNLLQEKEPDIDIRESAIDTLGQLGMAEGFTCLSSLLQDSNEPILQAAAVNALSKLNTPEVDQLLLEAVRNVGINTQVRLAAIEALGLLKRQISIDSLRELLNKDEDPEVRGALARLFGQIGDKNSVNELIRALYDPEVSVQGWAALSIGDLNEAKAVNALVEVLKDRNRDPFVRSSVAEALGSIKDKRAMQPLLNTLQDENPLVRRSTVIALGELGNSDIAEKLYASLKDPDARVRQAAAAILGDLENDQAVDVLLQALQDENIEVVAWSIAALGKLGDRRVISDLRVIFEERPRLKTWTVWALGKLGDKEALLHLSF